jgi:tRNA A-37 threonylcarbamoyl transferase component Bud32
MIISVDFDGTLALGNPSHITAATPNWILIERLKALKSKINPYIKVVTARGSKGKLSHDEKVKKYLDHIKYFLNLYNVPYDEISFNKEYADIYIDDMTIGHYDDFHGVDSYFTRNKIIFTEKTVIKKCTSSLFEKQWYEIAKKMFNVPSVLFINDETIITERLHNTVKPSVDDIIHLLNTFKDQSAINNSPFQTYMDRIVVPDNATPKVKSIISNLKEHKPTFFHGDVNTSNILKQDNKLWLIDPNFKNVFGSYMTDAGKAFFSFIAYEHCYEDANKIQAQFGDEVLLWSVAEGLRVTRYRQEFISIVNNIADLVKC